MSDHSTTPTAAEARAERLAQQLRANLRRRKAGRAGEPGDVAGNVDGADGADADLSKGRVAR